MMKMPKECKGLTFKINYREKKYEVSINKENEVFTKILNKDEGVIKWEHI